jgi:hypothetical protein
MIFERLKCPHPSRLDVPPQLGRGQVVEEHLSGLANEEVAESETFYVRHLHKEEKLV